MNLDNLALFPQIDSENMLQHVDALPKQVNDAWQHAHTLDIHPALSQVKNVVICGMGGSAISGDLLAALVFDSCKVSITSNRGYTLPAYASGEDTLVIGLSHSGNTEETLSAVEQGIDRGAQVLAITTGGEIAPMVESAGGNVWLYTYDAMPRASLGWLYTMLLASFSRLGLIKNLEDDVQETLVLLRKLREQFKSDIEISKNSAKRLAGQFVGRIPVMYGSGLLAPVAQRWKTQINENAKSAAYAEFLPELNHNAVVGTDMPTEALLKLVVTQLKSSRYDHPRVRVRQDATEKILLEQGIACDKVKARGESRLAQQMSLVQYGDYVSYYLALAYEIDPSPIPQIMALKARLAEVE